MHRLPTALMAALALAGCVPASGTPTPRQTLTTTRVETPTGGFETRISADAQIRTDTVFAPAEAAWSALVPAYLALGITDSQVNLIDPDGRRVGAMKLQVRRLGGQRLSSYLDCGHQVGTVRADQALVTISLETTLEPRGTGETVVHTRLDAQARDVGVSSQPLPCTSNGALERSIALAVKARTGESRWQ